MFQQLTTAARRIWRRLLNSSSTEELVEEQRVSACTDLDWYPVEIGERFDQYEVLGKLGWGQTSTVWLCKDYQ